MAKEMTLVLVKPDGVSRGLVGELIARFERRQIRIAGMKLIRAQRALVEEHYAEHRGKGFFDSVVQYLTSAPVVAMALEAEGAIGMVRQMTGATNPREAAPGTIRGDLALSIEANVVHTSADAEAALREVRLWFSSAELVE